MDKNNDRTMVNNKKKDTKNSEKIKKMEKKIKILKQKINNLYEIIENSIINTNSINFIKKLTDNNEFIYRINNIFQEKIENINQSILELLESNLEIKRKLEIQTMQNSNKKIFMKKINTNKDNYASINILPNKLKYNNSNIQAKIDNTNSISNINFNTNKSKIFKYNKDSCHSASSFLKSESNYISNINTNNDKYLFQYFKST